MKIYLATLERDLEIITPQKKPSLLLKGNYILIQTPDQLPLEGALFQESESFALWNELEADYDSAILRLLEEEEHTEYQWWIPALKKQNLLN